MNRAEEDIGEAIAVEVVDAGTKQQLVTHLICNWISNDEARGAREKTRAPKENLELVRRHVSDAGEDNVPVAITVEVARHES